MGFKHAMDKSRNETRARRYLSSLRYRSLGTDLIFVSSTSACLERRIADHSVTSISAVECYARTELAQIELQIHTAPSDLLFAVEVHHRHSSSPSMLIPPPRSML